MNMIRNGLSKMNRMRRVSLARGFSDSEPQKYKGDSQASNREWWTKLPPHEMLFDPVTGKMAHSVYKMKDIENIDVTFKTPNGLGDRWAAMLTGVFRFFFDTITRYSENNMTTTKWLNRVIFLETVAGVPGFVGGMCRHLRALRTMRRDRGWINHLLEEAENERQHLMVFMCLRQPGTIFRLAIVATQGVFMNVFFLSYLIAPRICHRFVGYLEEQAVKTYTHMLHDIDHGCLKEWGKGKASYEARQYWDLPEDSTWREIVKAIRADESIHRDFNHFLADLKPSDPVKHQHVVIRSPFTRHYYGDKEDD